jgi:4,4'-diaponeurosporenoate glycosyltransferase
MVLIAALCMLGWFAGWLLLRVVPVARGESASPLSAQVSIIIPARNEERNLPVLLASLHGVAPPPLEILVVDDGSTDATAATALRFGARVLPSAALPSGWTGKTWACYQGAQQARGEVYLFLDADTYLLPGGYARVLAAYAQLQRPAALSLLPYHHTRSTYEELSLFFNILMAMGAGGFSRLDEPHLFGQSMLIDRELYWAADGHGAVREQVLENLHLAPKLRAVGGRPYALGGRGTLGMRMFPDGLAQLRQSWRKAFANGAGATSRRVLWLSILWLSAAMLTFQMVVLAHARLGYVLLYLLFALQLAVYARQLGTFRWFTVLLYPLPLLFYFVVFGQSAWARAAARPVSWRGRAL